MVLGKSTCFRKFWLFAVHFNFVLCADLKNVTKLKTDYDRILDQAKSIKTDNKATSTDKKLAEIIEVMLPALRDMAGK